MIVANIIKTVERRIRAATVKRRDSGPLPAVGQRPLDEVRPCPRQSPDVGDYSAMTTIVGGSAPVGKLVGKHRRERAQAARSGSEYFRSVIKKLREGIGAAYREICVETPFDLKLCGVVPRVSTVGPNEDFTEVRILKYNVEILVVANARIEILVDEQSFSPGTHIRCRDNQLARQFPLNVQVPLLGHGVLQVALHGLNCAKRVRGGRDGCQRCHGVPLVARCRALAENIGAGRIRRRCGGIIHDVGEQTIVENAVSTSDHSCVMTEKPFSPVRRIGKAQPGTEVVGIGLLRGAERVRESGSGNAETKSLLYRRKLQCVPQRPPIFVAQSSSESQVLFHSVSVLYVGSVHCNVGGDSWISELLANPARGATDKVVYEVTERAKSAT